MRALIYDEALFARITDLEAQLEATNQHYLQVSAQTCRAEDLAEALQAQLADAQKDDWIPVSERLPEEGTEVIVYTPPLNGEDERYDFEKYEDECFVAHSNNYEHFCMVAKGGSDCAWIVPSEKPKYTHWMPLPQPPAMQAEGKA